MKMKRYMCFHMEHYYPCGGFGDFVFSTDDLGEAVAWCDRADKYTDRNIVELDESSDTGFKVVYER